MARCGRRVGATPRSRQITGTAFRRMEWPVGLHILLSRTQDSAAMRKRDLLRRKVQDIDLSRSSDLAALVEAMGHGGGFTPKKIPLGGDILRTTFRNPACTTFLSFPAALATTDARR